jgi:hypothetical protein
MTYEELWKYNQDLDRRLYNAENRASRLHDQVERWKADAKRYAENAEYWKNSREACYDNLLSAEREIGKLKAAELKTRPADVFSYLGNPDDFYPGKVFRVPSTDTRKFASPLTWEMIWREEYDRRAVGRREGVWQI